MSEKKTNPKISQKEYMNYLEQDRAFVTAKLKAAKHALQVAQKDVDYWQAQSDAFDMIYMRTTLSNLTAFSSGEVDHE